MQNKIFSISSVYSACMCHVCVCMCVYACLNVVCIFMCTHLWVKTRGHWQAISSIALHISFFETGYLTEPGLCLFC